jgi:hypothetical protein
MTEMDEELVSVAGFRDPTEAQMAKGMLESAGIETLMQGENANEAEARELLKDVELENDDA